MHLEKGAAFAARGMMLPPYDTRSTLQRLAACLDHFAPRRVVALGDSFHRSELAGRLTGREVRVDVARAMLLESAAGSPTWTLRAGDRVEVVGAKATEVAATASGPYRTATVEHAIVASATRPVLVRPVRADVD